MDRTVVKVTIADAILLAGVYLVLINRGWKKQCAIGNAVDCTARSSPHFSYSVFTIYFSMVSPPSTASPSGMLLQSPPSLDWVQVFVAALVVINAWYAYSALRHRVAPQITRPDQP